MDAISYYEDAMPESTTNQDEYLKYFIDESLNLFDKLNNIIKKGQPFQKQALLNNLYTYIDNSLFKSLMQFIIDDIGTWDTATLILFPKSIYNVFAKSTTILNNDLFNIIFKHLIVTISSDNEKVLDEYIFYFEKIIELFSTKKIFPYILNNEIFEIIISLGKFGSSINNRKICCYLTSCLCRIIKDDNNANLHKLFGRILLLFCDNEKSIETQMARELQYLIPIFNEKLFNNSDITKAIDSYINCYSDHIIQTTVLVSLIKNIKYLNEDLINNIIEKMNEILTSDNYEEDNKNNIFNTLIDTLYKNFFSAEDEIMNKILSANYMKYYINREQNISIIIQNFEKIHHIFRYINKNENFEEYKINFDELFINIYNKLFSKTNSNKCSSYIENDKSEDIQNIFYQNINNIIPCLSNLKINKILYEKIYQLFKKESIINVLKNFVVVTNNNSNNVDKKKQNTLYNLLLYLLKKSQEFLLLLNTDNNKNLLLLKKKRICSSSNDLISDNSNNNYNKIFNLILSSIFIIYNEKEQLFSNEMHLMVSHALKMIIKDMRIYLSTIINAKENNSLMEKILDEMHNKFLVKIIRKKNMGYYIKSAYIQIFPYLILYSKNRKIYINFIKNEILNSPQYFTRRYSIIFMKKALKIFSLNFFNTLELIDELISLINDKSNEISSCIIKLINHESKNILVNSSYIFSRLHKIIKKINENMMTDNNFDIEKKKAISIFLSINCNDIDKNDEGSKFIENEKKKILEENEILNKEQKTSKLNSSSNIKNVNINQNLNNVCFSRSPQNKANTYHNKVNNNLISCSVNNLYRKRGSLKEKSSSMSFLNCQNFKKVNKNFLPKINYKKQESLKIRSNNNINEEINNNKNSCIILNNRYQKNENEKLPLRKSLMIISHNQNRFSSGKICKERNSFQISTGKSMLEVENFNTNDISARNNNNTGQTNRVENNTTKFRIHSIDKFDGLYNKNKNLNNYNFKQKNFQIKKDNNHLHYLYASNKIMTSSNKTKKILNSSITSYK